jgi:hypothetical protein
MASKKIKDLAVKTGSYTDRDGNTKGRYLNVGSLMKSDDGSVFILLNTTFNPAGVPNPDNRDNVLISVFDLKDADQQQGGGQTRRPPAQQSAPKPQQDFSDDDIPF